LNSTSGMTSSSDKEEPIPQSHHHHHHHVHQPNGKEENDGGDVKTKNGEQESTVDHQLTTTQKNKYSHRHVHLSYIYLFQSFGELTGHLEDSILTSVGSLPTIGEQMMNRYDDLKRQSNAVWKVINGKY